MTRATGLTIGNFDGVHRGHVELVSAARTEVGPSGRVVVLSFDPHPISVLRPDSTPARLTSFDQRKQLLIEAGADEVIALRPTRTILGLEAVDFIRSVAIDHSPAVIVEGPDFCFGRGRSGSIDTLRRHEAEFGYRTVVIDPVEAVLNCRQVVRVSSTMLRWLITRGRVDDARHLLGRPYDLIGPVISGEKRGRTIGVPTANLDHGDLLLPADGIYAGRAVIAQDSVDAGSSAVAYPAAISVGTKPTFGTHPRVCEAHLIGYDGPADRYGWTLKLEFHHWLRDQLTYDRVEALTDQLQRDIANTLERIDERVDDGSMGSDHGGDSGKGNRHDWRPSPAIS